MTRIARATQSREGRTSVASQRNRLSVGGLDPNFQYRWVNAIDERLQIFLNAGYVFVMKSEVTKVGDPLVDNSEGTEARVTKGVGGGIKAYLMKIPKSLYEEYQAEKREELREMQRAMGTLKSGHKYSQDADYGSVKIEQK